MKNFFRKITSRKFIVTALSAISGLVTLFAGENELVQIIASALMVVIPTIVYCITEGAIDKASVKTITDTVADTAEKLGASDEVIDTIEKVGEIGEILTEKSTDE